MNQPTNNGGWSDFTPRHGKRYAIYDTRCVAIVSVTSKGACIYLTKKVLETLHMPKRIGIKTRAADVALFKAGENEPGYTVNYGDGNSNATPYINVLAFAKEFSLRDGIFEAHMETHPDHNVGVMVVWSNASQAFK